MPSPPKAASSRVWLKSESKFDLVYTCSTSKLNCPVEESNSRSPPAEK